MEASNVSAVNHGSQSFLQITADLAGSQDPSLKLQTQICPSRLLRHLRHMKRSSGERENLPMAQLYVTESVVALPEG